MLFRSGMIGCSQKASAVSSADPADEYAGYKVNVESDAGKSEKENTAAPVLKADGKDITVSITNDKFGLVPTSNEEIAVIAKNFIGEISLISQEELDAVSESDRTEKTVGEYSGYMYQQDGSYCFVIEEDGHQVKVSAPEPEDNVTAVLTALEIGF